tara:strand:+ start:355 stop:798 length:444 start_codon:yes stop_codon:yes gene_type:complete
MENKKDRLKELYKYYNLQKEDVFKHQKLNWIIVRRTGIDKIMSKDSIKITYEIVDSDLLTGCVIKATAKKDDLQIETFGSATTKNSHSTYFAEMAEKRAKSRAVLMITEFYSLGVYAEDEADDFKKSNVPAKFGTNTNEILKKQIEI